MRPGDAVKAEHGESAATRALGVLTGDPRSVTLEGRLFNTISLLNGVANLGGALWPTPGAGSPSQRALHAATGLVFLGIYWMARTRGRYRSLYWPFVVSILAFLLVNALGNAATLGGAHYYLVPALVIATILAPRMRETLAAAALFAGAVWVLVGIEAARPDLVASYARPDDRAIDVGANLVFAGIFTSALVVILAKKLNIERHKSDGLLRNVLPDAVAEELKHDGRVRPRSYSSATVLFTDCVGFTRIAEGLSAEALVTALDEVFSRFDTIASRHGLEKIKTIGDAYMAVGGVPEPTATHAVDCARAALEMVGAVDEIARAREVRGLPGFRIRVGLHTGPLVAGVIGCEKFAYDVWGDTVNVASRMESAGAPGRVNVSAATLAALDGALANEPRGRIAVKGKGEIDMYFIEAGRTIV